MTHAGLREHITVNPRRACVFWFEVGQRCRQLPHAHLLPHWRGNGLNHIFIDHADAGIDAPTRKIWLGRAALAQGHATTERFVRGLDVSLGLHIKSAAKPGERLLTTPPWLRKWLLTFKGTHSHVSRVRAGLHHHEARRVVLATYPHPMQCMTSTKIERPFAAIGSKRLHPLHADCCNRMKYLYGKYHYDDLMNSSFALVMPGRQPASYRLAEVMARGCIPVFYGFEDAVLPYEELIDWSAFSLTAPLDVDFEGVLFPMLEAAVLDRPRMVRMQRALFEVYRKYFDTLTATAGDRAVVETLRRRFSLEMRRGRALSPERAVL